MSDPLERSRIPALDGWRGIAILTVLVSHTLSALKLSWAIGPFANMGAHGVTIFFVLSGFLVTSTLLRDDQQDSLCLARFYIKRFFRLLPTTWIYILLIFFVNSSLLLHQEVAACLLFFRNYKAYPGHYMTVHFWSLSIEEQFYLLWPPLLLLLGTRRAAWAAGIGAAAIAMYRFENWDFYNRDYWWYRTEVKADALLIGCVAAIVCSDENFRLRIKKHSVLLCVLASAIMSYCAWNFILSPGVESLAIAILLLLSVDASGSVAGRLLGNPVLTWVGRISYSLYIWNIFFLDLTRAGKPIQDFTVMFLLFGAAAANYYLIERPGTQFGRSLSRLVRDVKVVPASIIPGK